MPRNKLSDPYDPDCLVAECPNIVHRRGVCKKHWRELPQAWKREWAIEQMTVMHELGKKHGARVELFYADRLKPEADRLSPARRA